MRALNNGLFQREKVFIHFFGEYCILITADKSIPNQIKGL